MDFFSIAFGGNHIYMDLLELKEQEEPKIFSISAHGKKISVKTALEKTTEFNDQGEFEYKYSLPLTAFDTIRQGALLIPITHAQKSRFWDFIGMSQLLHTSEPDLFRNYTGTFPYYFSKDMSPTPSFERKGLPPVKWDGTAESPLPKNTGIISRLFGRSQVEPIDHDSFERSPDDIPFARYNCWTVCRDILQYIVQVDVNGLHPAFATANRQFEASAAWENLTRNSPLLLMRQLPQASFEWREKIAVVPGPNGAPAALSYEHLEDFKSIELPEWQLFTHDHQLVDDAFISPIKWLEASLSKQMDLTPEDFQI